MGFTSSVSSWGPCCTYRDQGLIKPKRTSFTKLYPALASFTQLWRTPKEHERNKLVVSRRWADINWISGKPGHPFFHLLMFFFFLLPLPLCSGSSIKQQRLQFTPCRSDVSATCVIVLKHQAKKQATHLTDDLAREKELAAWNWLCDVGHQVHCWSIPAVGFQSRTKERTTPYSSQLQ